MSATLAVEAAGLRKTYGRTTVLDGVDLRVAAGTVLALLGPNGAGKTTTVRILTTLVAPDGGEVRIAGFPLSEPHEIRRRISLTGQYAALDEAQTGAENLRMIGRLSRLGRTAARRRADELLERFDLVEAGGRRVGTYSGGMRRRLDLAASLVGRPEIIFLDEPTTGLDLRARQSLWEVVGELAAGGVTVFLTTQYLDEADRLADRIAVVDGGRVVAEGTADELKGQVAGFRLDLVAADAAGYGRLAASLGDGVLTADPIARTLGVATDGSAQHVRSVLDRLDPAGDTVARFAVHGASLDDVFLSLTGHPTEEETHA